MQISLDKYTKGHTFGMVFEDIWIKIVDSFEGVKR